MTQLIKCSCCNVKKDPKHFIGWRNQPTKTCEACRHSPRLKRQAQVAAGIPGILSDEWLQLCDRCSLVDCKPDSDECPIRVAYRLKLRPEQATNGKAALVGLVPVEVMDLQDKDYFEIANQVYWRSKKLQRGKDDNRK